MPEPMPDAMPELEHDPMRKPVRERARIVAGALVLACMALYAFLNLRLSTELTQFLDESTERELAAVSRQLMDSPVTRTMVLAIEARDLATSLAAARRLALELAAHSEVASVRTGPPEDLAEAVYALYFPHRLAFMSSRPEHELPERLSDRGLEAAARELKRQLALPSSGLIQRLAREDPLLAFPGIVARLERAQEGTLEIVDGQFAAGDQALIFVESRRSAFDAQAQAPLEQHLQAALARLDRELPGGVRVQRSGAHRFAVGSAQKARFEAGVISIASTLSIVLLFGVVFRSVRWMVVAFVPLAAGMLAAVCVGLWLFGELHVLTLAFGSTLIGVCIDYPVHVITQHVLEPHAGGLKVALRKVRMALVLGAGTTIAGFAGIAWSGFPGVREVGVFSAVGVFAALIATFVLLPALGPRSVRTPAVAVQSARAVLACLEWLAARKRSLWVIVVLWLIVVATGLPKVAWLDDVFELNVPAESAWLEEEQAVRAKVSRMDSGRFVVALADDEESALALNDRLFLRLEDARTRGLLDEFQSLHRFLFSAELQRRNLDAVAASSELPARLEAALARGGFRPAAFAPFETSLGVVPSRPLTLADLQRSPLRDIVRALYVELGDRIAILTLVRGVTDAATLRAALADLEGVHFFDQRSFLRDIYGRYRERTVMLLAAGLCAVIALLALRYRSPWIGLLAAGPAIAACMATLSVLALCGMPIHLLHLLGLVLVVSIGVDYSIFLLEIRDAREVAGTMLALVIACATELLGFGLLAFSSFPALQGLGATTTIGVLGSLLLAPVVLATRRFETTTAASDLDPRDGASA